MASIVQLAPTQHQPSFARHSTAFKSGASSQHIVHQRAQSRSSLTAGDSTPKSSQNSMSYGVSVGFGTPNGNHQPQRPYGDLNGHAVQQQQPPANRTPSIYTAQYSGVHVYEMEVNNVAVMRRRADSWLNATQILKVAGIEKGKRTKVLEKEILSGEHEKVQGGYGKYQGTWISYKRGRDFCRSYGVEELLRPLLEYDMTTDGQAGEGTIDTPTKEQAMAAQRKKMMLTGTENRSMAQTPNGTFFKNLGSSAATAIQALNKSRIDSPGPRPGSGNKRPVNVRRPSQQMNNSQESQYQISSQQSLHSEGSYGINGQLDSFSGAANAPYYTKASRTTGDQEPPRKRIKQYSIQQYSQHTNGDLIMEDATPTEPNESFAYNNFNTLDQDSPTVGIRPLPQPVGALAMQKQKDLSSLFLDPNQTEFSNHATFDLLGGEELDIPIDDTAHTVMHWASTLAKPALLRTLISKGANIFRVNSGGETSLMKAVQTTNNFEQNRFPELLDLLGPTIETRDDRGRTVLHHIAISSSIRGKSAACRYYLESLLEFVVRQGSASNTQSFHGDASFRYKPIGLAKFMSEIVNAQDMSGDTALNIAARNYSKGVVQQLLEVGANASIANGGGFKPLDFGIAENDAEDLQSSSQATLTSSQKTANANRVADTSRDLMSSISSLIVDTETSFLSELKAKQSLVDQAQAKLRDVSTSLTSERRKVEDLQTRADARSTLQHRISNLRLSNDSNRSHLATTGPPARQDVSLGDADAGLTVDTARLPVNPDATKLTPEQEAFLDTLPPPSILDARLRAYEMHNNAVEEKKMMLKGKSTKLEQKLRKLIALSTGIEEAKVDTMLGPLRDAVESEGGEELDHGRLRDFLRKVHTSP